MLRHLVRLISCTQSSLARLFNTRHNNVSKAKTLIGIWRRLRSDVVFPLGFEQRGLGRCRCSWCVGPHLGFEPVTCRGKGHSPQGPSAPPQIRPDSLPHFPDSHSSDSLRQLPVSLCFPFLFFHFCVSSHASQSMTESTVCARSTQTSGCVNTVHVFLREREGHPESQLGSEGLWSTDLTLLIKHTAKTLHMLMW